MSLQFPLFSNGIVGESPAMRALDRQIGMAARCDLTVLVSGESGTGKELVARAIHKQSARAEMPFISINCGALAETLLESELFGYERGAFTGANQTRRGLFEAAHTGTIFLDEIGEMSTACQVKLLRVLQERAVRPVGAHNEVPVDVRVIAATNRDVRQEIAFGHFRQDLFYRIAVLTISTPSLRERASDIPLLVEHFLREAAKNMKRGIPGIEPNALTALSLYTWPGNVRQLQHIVERLVAGIRDSEKVTAEGVHQALQDVNLFETSPQVPMVFREDDSLDEFLDRIVLGLYNHFRGLTGSHSGTARALRINRGALYQRVERARERVSGNGSSKSEEWQD